MQLCKLCALGISIHAPRGGSDRKRSAAQVSTQISIHAPRGGSDELLREIGGLKDLFLSTLPVGGAT